MKHLKVTFEVNVGEYPDTRLTEDFVRMQIDHVGEVILDAFDETIHEIVIKEE